MIMLIEREDRCYSNVYIKTNQLSIVTPHSSECPCGASTVTFISASPDHPWARPSQTRYSAVIDCVDCQDNFIVHQNSSNDMPVIVEKAEVEAKKQLREQIQALDAAIMRSAQVKRLRTKIVDAIDKEISMAGRHRKLKEFHLTVDSYSTYRKKPYGGEEALRFTRGSTFARIGATTALGGEDQPYFMEAIDEIERMEDVERKICLKVVDLKPSIT